MEISEQIAVFLDQKGFGKFDKSGIAGNIFINAIPENPDESLAIFTTGGPESDPLNQYGYSSIQILIRTIPNDPRAGEPKARQIVDALNGFNSDYMAPGGNYIIDVSAVQSGPNNIGMDRNNRFEYSQNFIIEYQK